MSQDLFKGLREKLEGRPGQTYTFLNSLCLQMLSPSQLPKHFLIALSPK